MFCNFEKERSIEFKLHTTTISPLGDTHTKERNTKLQMFRFQIQVKCLHQGDKLLS